MIPDRLLEMDYKAFDLPLRMVIEVERQAGDRPITEIYEALSGENRLNQIAHQDAWEVIRAAAIGGGMSPVDAGLLIAQHIALRPLAESIPLAALILHFTLQDVRLKRAGTRAGPAERFRRGSVIASCGVLGLDYQTAALGEFAEAVEAHNETPSPDRRAPASPEFRAHMQRLFDAAA